MKHGCIYFSRRTMGSFDWPSIARLPDGKLAVVCSGFRQHHVDPYGKTIMFYSNDNGISWSAPSVIIDTPLDTRDAGIIVHNGKVFVTTFALPREYYTEVEHPITAETKQMWNAYCSFITDEENKHYTGSLCAISEDGGYSFGEPYKMPVFAPHGMIKLNDGRLFYVGHHEPHKIVGVGYCFSEDGVNFTDIVDFDLPQECVNDPDFVEFCEPHAVQLKNGKIVVLVRLETKTKLTMLQCESYDGGKTFTKLHKLNVPEEELIGAPPHIIQHSSGVLILSYGYREKPLGQKIRLSYDGGETWSEAKTLRDDGKDWDLGYPCTLELQDGKLITVYYQKPEDPQICNNAAILYTIWDLNEFKE